MQTVVVDYDSLATVQNEYKNLAEDSLAEACTELNAVHDTIEGIGAGHDNLWSDTLSSIKDEINELNSSKEDIYELSEMTGEASSTFADSEGQIVRDIKDIADYFGLNPDGSYTVTQNTGAEVSLGAQTERSRFGSPANSYDSSTGATTTSSPATTTIVSRANNSDYEDPKETTETTEKPKEEEKKTEEKKEEPKDNTKDKKAKEEPSDTSRDIKDSSTYKEAKENAEKVSQKSGTKNITDDTSKKQGTTTTTMGSATEAASNVGKTNNTSSTSDKANTSQTEKVEEEKAEIRGQAAGEILDDDFVINDDLLETDSGTHQTSPIDVTIDKNTSADIIPALAGVAAAGLTGVGTKAVLDKKGNEDEDEEDEEETFNGDYNIAGEEENQLLDTSDDIGFNPETIIEEDENIRQIGLQKEVYPQSVLQDIQSNE